jgi:dTDP-4-dehydrorhamnose reductase
LRQRRRRDDRLKARLLVTGAGGLIGGRLAFLLAETHDVVAGIRRSAPPPGLRSVPFDLERAGSLPAALEAAQPDAVVHCAALPDPDACEREPDRARVCNVEAPAALARLCHQRGIHLVALSTDLVFASRRQPYAESAPAEPVLAYGRSKLAGEEAMLVEDAGATILRLPLMHGRGHGSRPTASEAVAWALGVGRPLRLFSDQFRTPVDAESVADAITRVLAGGHAGRFHLGGDERVSRYELGLRVAALLHLPAALITPIRQGALPLAPRPADVSLDNRHARDVLGWRPRPLDAGIREGRVTAV